jgi:hypothetical protein
LSERARSNYQLPTTNYQSPITNHFSLLTSHSPAHRVSVTSTFLASPADASAQIWNLASGKLEKRIQAGIGAMAVFSPGNECLVLSGAICQAISVPAWADGPRISSDASILAFFS